MSQLAKQRAKKAEPSGLSFEPFVTPNERQPAKAKTAMDRFIDYVGKKHGEHEADEVKRAFEEVPAGRLRQFVATRYLDPKADALFRDVSEEMGTGSLDRMLDVVRKRWGKDEAAALENAFNKMPVDRLAPKVASRYKAIPQVYELFRNATEELGMGQHGPVKGPGEEPSVGKYYDTRTGKEAPWKAPIPNKIKGFDRLAGSDANDDDGGAIPEPVEDEPTEKNPAAPSQEQDPRDLLPGDVYKARGDRPSGFAQPAPIKAQKPQTSEVPAGVEPTKGKAGKSDVVRIQKLLWNFAQQHGPRPADKGETRARKEDLISRMERKYGLPVPKTNLKTGQPIILNADQVAKRFGGRPTQPLAKNTKDAEKLGVGPGQKPPFPPQFNGQMVQQRGFGKKALSWYPIQATGQMAMRTSETDPAKEGPIWLGYGGEWKTPSEVAALRAAGKLPATQKPKSVYNPDQLLPQWLRNRKTKLG